MSRQYTYAQLRHELDVDALLRMAQDRAGLSDFGSRRFYEPLGKFLDCVARDVDFHAQGLAALKGDIHRILINRLRMQDDIKRHPEILEEDVSDPIIIVGLGRSGTTKLHKMLSAPDDVQKTYFWRLWNPAPFPDSAPGDPDPRIRAAGTAQMMTEDKPLVDAGHHMEEQEVEEEGFLYMATFDEWSWTQLVPSPSYFDWVMQRDSLEPFREARTMLQYLQWQDGGKRGRPWILKLVTYLANMDSLLACYPKATLVHPHRDPRVTIPSWSKLQLGLWAIYAHPIDPQTVGMETQRMWSFAMSRYMEARDRLQLDGRILDVHYEQIRTDPMPIMAAARQRSGYPMTNDAEAKMASWHANNEQGRYGKHEYSLQEFGLSPNGIDQAFKRYIDRFINRRA